MSEERGALSRHPGTGSPGELLGSLLVGRSLGDRLEGSGAGSQESCMKFWQIWLVIMAFSLMIYFLIMGPVIPR